MNERAIDCFDQAMRDVGIDEDQPLWPVLHDYFSWATTTTMYAFHESADDVPAGIEILRWSRGGLLSGPGA